MQPKLHAMWLHDCNYLCFAIAKVRFEALEDLGVGGNGNADEVGCHGGGVGDLEDFFFEELVLGESLH